VVLGPEALALEPGEARALAGELAPLWAEPGARLEAPVPQRWYLAFDAPRDLEALPLSGVRGADAARWPLRGADARGLQRVLTEVQMQLHGSPVNEARATRGLPPVNSLWLWGGGVLPAGVTTPWAGVRAEDAFVRGLGALGGAAAGALPASADAWLAEGPVAGEHLVLLEGAWDALRYGDVEAWRGALDALSRDWAGPLAAAVARGELGEAVLATERGQRLRLTRRGARRWWRRDRPVAAWVEA
jgi:hypothetical protein